MRIRGLVALLVAGLGVTAAATPAKDARATHRGSPTIACPTSARVEIAVPAEVDEVRAVVADTAPGAAAAVTVVTGRSDRQLSMFGGGTWGLQLGSPLPAGRMIVAVEPVLDAAAPACVDHVELLRRGAVVARVVPR